MIYSIENNQIKAQVDTKGAQLMSLYSKKTETEYLWQGDPAYWTGRAYNLFPVIGRTYGGTYFYHGQEYEIGIHGFARSTEFSLETRTATKLVFLMTDTEETRAVYPFRFEFRVIFEIENSALTIRYAAKNLGENVMICAFGGHPGINVPFGKGEFEDYYLEFSEPSAVVQQLLSENKLMANETAPYALEDGVKIPLRHELFDNDAIILQRTSRQVSVKSEKEERYVTMRYEDFKYIGFWHACETDAPYVCLEPWTALPATDGTKDTLETKADMTQIQPQKSAEVAYTIEIHE